MAYHMVYMHGLVTMLNRTKNIKPKNHISKLCVAAHSHCGVGILKIRDKGKRSLYTLGNILIFPLFFFLPTFPTLAPVTHLTTHDLDQLHWSQNVARISSKSSQQSCEMVLLQPLLRQSRSKSSHCSSKHLFTHFTS